MVNVKITNEYNLTASQVRLLRILKSRGAVYLFGRMETLASKTVGIWDTNGVGRYGLTLLGYKILSTIDLNKNENRIISLDPPRCYARKS